MRHCVWVLGAAAWALWVSVFTADASAQTVSVVEGRQVEDTAETGVAASAREPSGDLPEWRQTHPMDASQFTFKPGVGAVFSSRDGKFELQLRMFGQILYQAEHRFNGATEKMENVSALMVRRFRFIMAGHAFSKDIQYHLQASFAPRELGLGQGDANLGSRLHPPITNNDNVVTLAPLFNFYLQFNQLRDLNVRVGQYKIAYNRERVVPVSDLQFVDRSLANQEFNYDRDIGIDFRSSDLFGLDKKLRYVAGVSTGKGHSANNLVDFGYVYLLRLEYLPLGNFDDYVQVDVLRTRTPKISLGAAYVFANRARGNRGIIGHTFSDDGWANYHNATADLVFKFRGLSVEAAGYLRKGSRQPGSFVDELGQSVRREDPRDGIGATAQAGYVVSGRVPLEVSGRYSAIGKLGDETQLQKGQELGPAISYYFQAHLLKLQLDFMHQWGQGIQNVRGVPLTRSGAFSEGNQSYRAQLTAGF